MQVTLDAVLSRRGITGKDVARQVGLSETQLSLFRSGKVRGIRFTTLARLCLVLECQPGDLLAYTRDPADMAVAEGGADLAGTGRRQSTCQRRHLPSPRS